MLCDVARGPKEGTSNAEGVDAHATDDLRGRDGMAGRDLRYIIAKR